MLASLARLKPADGVNTLPLIPRPLSRYQRMQRQSLIDASAVGLLGACSEEVQLSLGCPGMSALIGLVILRVAWICGVRYSRLLVAHRFALEVLLWPT